MVEPPHAGRSLDGSYAAPAGIRACRGHGFKYSLGPRPCSGHPPPLGRLRRVGDNPAQEDLFPLASCVATADYAAEIAVLVEDSYQRQGIGSTMLRMLIAHADHRDIATLQATVLAEQEWILPFMRSFGSCSATLRMGVFDMTLRREKGRPAWIG